MKKNILSMAALLIASATAFTACSSSDDSIISENQQPAQPTGKYTMTIQASKGGDATTRALSLEGKTLNATWATTEHVYVKKGNTWATGSLQPEADGATATLKGTLSDVTITANDVLTLQFPKSGDISYAGQVGTLEDIAANFDYATATVTVASVSASGNIVPTAATTTFENQQSVVKFTLKDKNSETLLNAGTVRVQATYGVSSSIFDTEFTIPDDTYTANGDGIIYLAIPNTGSYFSTLISTYGYNLATIKSSCRLNITATVGSNTYTYTKEGWPFEDGQYYEITVKMAEVLKPDLLSGVFSVSSTKKVKFSKGNLRYASGTWSFFNNQYDYYTSYSTDAWDKFGWSTSTTTYGMNTSTDNSDYSGDFVDWGATMGTGWFTLSEDEWTYLFKTRTVNGGTGSGKSYTLGQSVNGKLGVVIYPDNYTGEVYSGSDWATFESAGCVFLPAAGYRNGSSVNEVGTGGSYWSSTDVDDGARYVGFDSGYLGASYYDYRYDGQSVRLVRQVE